MYCQEYASTVVKYDPTKSIFTANYPAFVYHEYFAEHSGYESSNHQYDAPTVVSREHLLVNFPESFLLIGFFIELFFSGGGFTLYSYEVQSNGEDIPCCIESFSPYDDAWVTMREAISIVIVFEPANKENHCSERNKYDEHNLYLLE